MKFITLLIKFIQVLLLGNPTQKADLHKKNKTTIMESIEEWALSYAHILLPLAFIILLLLIGAVIGVMLSGGNMTMTDSNLYYYHFNDVI